MSSELYFSEFQLSKVCAFVDAQGFSLPKKDDSPFLFKPRELTFYGEQGSITREFNTSIEIEKFSSDTQKIFRYQSFYIHGFPFKLEVNDLNYASDFERHVTGLYEFFKSESKEFLAVKDDSLASILQDLGIKHINLNSNVSVPRLAELDERYQNYSVCNLHNKPKHSLLYQCSFRKAKHYWKWISENKVKGYHPIF